MAGGDAHADADEVAVTIEPASGDDLLSLLLAAYALSPRERDICREVMAGGSTAEIGERLSVSPHTVQDHLKSAFAKVGVPAPKGNTVQVKAHVAEAPGPSGTFAIFSSVPTFFEPPPLGKIRWRKLAVAVSPEGVKTFWEGAPMAKSEFSFEAMNKQSNHMIGWELKLDVMPKHLAEVSAQFGPRQGLGVLGKLRARCLPVTLPLSTGLIGRPSYCSTPPRSLIHSMRVRARPFSTSTVASGSV